MSAEAKMVITKSTVIGYISFDGSKVAMRCATLLPTIIILVSSPFEI